ncbi:hypothetical protein [Pseudomonas lundensis]|uniref:hypothetical protein n=1 Tax=Pseudomonas lundensis TaxID=86185 RepID=UPI0021CC7DEE|nr:hypothetical protein [Pseudomonas lundensis]
MISLLNAFKAAPARPDPANLDMDRFKRLRWQTFLSMSLSYALFYVCRLSFNVVKPALVAHNLLSPAQLGIIGSALFALHLQQRRPPTLPKRKDSLVPVQP